MHCLYDQVHHSWARFENQNHNNPCISDKGTQTATPLSNSSCVVNVLCFERSKHSSPRMQQAKSCLHNSTLISTHACLCTYTWCIPRRCMRVMRCWTLQRQLGLASLYSYRVQLHLRRCIYPAASSIRGLAAQWSAFTKNSAFIFNTIPGFLERMVIAMKAWNIPDKRAVHVRSVSRHQPDMAWI